MPAYPTGRSCLLVCGTHTTTPMLSTCDHRNDACKMSSNVSLCSSLQQAACTAAALRMMRLTTSGIARRRLNLHELKGPIARRTSGEGDEAGSVARAEVASLPRHRRADASADALPGRRRIRRRPPLATHTCGRCKRQRVQDRQHLPIMRMTLVDRHSGPP